MILNSLTYKLTRSNRYNNLIMNIPDLKLDLFNSQMILEKIVDYNYAQNLYAAICNNEFQKDKSNFIWTRSWRSSGRLIAELRNSVLNSAENYMTYYCSGIQSQNEDLPDDIYNRIKNYVHEGVVTEEIKNDLASLGWKVI